MRETTSDFDRAMSYVLHHKGLLFLLLCFGAALGAGASFLVTPRYKADALLIPSDDLLGVTQTGGLGGLGGLASLVGGIGVNSNKQSEAVETLKSRSLTIDYIQANNLMPVLFHDRWDSASKQWKGGQFSRPPTLADAWRVFDKDIRAVIENRKTGMVSISILWEDPKLAKEWTSGLVDATNAVLRKQALERSNLSLEYLQKAADKTAVVEVKNTIYKLMEAEIKKQMVAYGGRDYAFRFVDPPVVPERKVSPIRSLYLVMGALALPALWCGFAIFRGVVARLNS